LHLLVIQDSPVSGPENTADRRLKRYSISLYSPESERLIYLTDIADKRGMMGFAHGNNDELYIAINAGWHYLFSIPDISSYINNNTNITDWKNHE